jgi:hypothetical protein
MRTLIAAALGLLVAAPLSAADPNIQPGEWEVSSRITTTGFMPMPEQNVTETQCIRAEDITADALMALPVEDGCEITHRESSRDRATLAWTCDVNQGGMQMQAEGRADMRFNGDRSDGTMNMKMTTPMGDLDMQGIITGRRTGDC